MRLFPGRSFTIAALIGTSCIGAIAQTILIENVRIVDGTGSPAKTGSVAVKDGWILAVGENVQASTGARRIDGHGKTLLPGLFDLHTHLRASAASGLTADWGKDLEAYLAAGVTSVDDFGNYGEMFAPMRKLLETGAVLGPRLHLAVRISPPGGHGTESGYGDMFTLEASTPEAAHAAMRQALLSKPDIIKVFTDGWRYGTIPNLMSMNEETIAAIVEDAHAAGIKFLPTRSAWRTRELPCVPVSILLSTESRIMKSTRSLFRSSNRREPRMSPLSLFLSRAIATCCTPALRTSWNLRSKQF